MSSTQTNGVTDEMDSIQQTATTGGASSGETVLPADKVDDFNKIDGTSGGGAAG